MDNQTRQNLLALVKRNYEEIASGFDRTRKKQLWPALIKLTELVKNGDRVLDAGCGNGRLAGALAKKNVYYLGVDSSEKLINLAKKSWGSVISNFQFPISNQIPNSNDQKNTKYKMPDFKFLVADILELAKLPETDFDYVFCVAVLHHLPSDNLRLKALEQMKNKLKPGGRLVITVWNLWAQNKFLKMIFKYGLLKLAGRNKMDFGDILFNWQDNQGKSLSRRYYHAFTGAGLKKLAQTVGFYIENICHDQYNYYLILKK